MILSYSLFFARQKFNGHQMVIFRMRRRDALALKKMVKYAFTLPKRLHKQKSSNNSNLRQINQNGEEKIVNKIYVHETGLRIVSLHYILYCFAVEMK